MSSPFFRQVLLFNLPRFRVSIRYSQYIPSITHYTDFTPLTHLPTTFKLISPYYRDPGI